MGHEHLPAASDKLFDASITLREERVITVLVSQGSIRAASRASGISERTIYRYLQQEAFRRELAHRLMNLSTPEPFSGSGDWPVAP